MRRWSMTRCWPWPIGCGGWRPATPGPCGCATSCSAARELANGGQRRQPLPWARPPEQTPLGVPVEWLSGFRRVACSAAARHVRTAQNPGRFAIACGLALAGIRQAALRINLLSAEQRGMLQRVKNFMQPQIVRSAWGIDLGVSSLKAVKLAWNQAKQQAVIEAVVLIEHAKMLSHAANEAEEGRLVAETLKTFLKAHEIKGERLCVGLPGRMTLSRQIDLPPVDPAKAAKLLQFEAPRPVSLPVGATGLGLSASRRRCAFADRRGEGGDGRERSPRAVDCGETRHDATFSGRLPASGHAG